MTCLDANGHEKAGYENRTAATRAMERRVKANPTLDLRVYRCPECGKFHLTHLPDRAGESA